MFHSLVLTDENYIFTPGVRGISVVQYADIYSTNQGLGCFRGAGRVEIKMLMVIKLLHTLIWAFLAANVVAIPVLGVLRRFRWAAILTGIVLLECGVLAINGGRCPLSDLAARFTDDRAHNFDIYLPNWLAQHNKVIFGVLFVAGELALLGFWLRDKYQLRRPPLLRL